MENKHPKLGDLVKPERLKKLEDNVQKMELGAKPEKIKHLADKMSGVAGSIEGDMNTKAGEVTDLVEAMRKTMVKELSPEQAKALLATFKARFQRDDKKLYKAMEGLHWQEVQDDILKRLRENPEKLWSLNEMERTGGEPDVFGWDPETDEYIFMDFSKESPSGRRDVCYDRAGQQEGEKRGKKPNGNAVSGAAMMGINLLTESEYRELQERGKFDLESWSWLKTPFDMRRNSVALGGNCGGDEIRVREASASYHSDRRGFRGSLRV